MASITKTEHTCDRCRCAESTLGEDKGQLPADWEVVTRTGDSGEAPTEPFAYDLCAKCMRSFGTWFVRSVFDTEIR